MYYVHVCTCKCTPSVGREVIRVAQQAHKGGFERLEIRGTAKNPTAKLFPTGDPESPLAVRGISSSLPTKLLKEKCGLDERYATVEDVKTRADTRPTTLSTGEYQTMRVWGPVLEEDGKRVGALGQAFSFCLNVLSLLPSSLLDRVKAVVPEAMQQKPDDTPQSLKARIRSHPLFEPMKVFWRGKKATETQMHGGSPELIWGTRPRGKRKRRSPVRK